MAFSKNFKVIVIGGSAGSFSVLSEILRKINPDFKIPIILSLHRLKHVRSGLVEGLSLSSVLEVVEPNDKEKLRPNTVFLAPSNYHLFLELDGSFSLSTEESLNHSRPSIDYTLTSTAYAYRHNVLGILLTGANIDGAQGLKQIHNYKGVTIVQDPKTCEIDTMPKAALQIFEPDFVLSPTEIIDFLNSIEENKS